MVLSEESRNENTPCTTSAPPPMPDTNGDEELSSSATCPTKTRLSIVRSANEKIQRYSSKMKEKQTRVVSVLLFGRGQSVQHARTQRLCIRSVLLRKLRNDAPTTWQKISTARQTFQDTSRTYRASSSPPASTTERSRCNDRAQLSSVAKTLSSKDVRPNSCRRREALYFWNDASTGPRPGKTGSGGALKRN